jgi:hypothetical protein
MDPLREFDCLRSKLGELSGVRCGESCGDAKGFAPEERKVKELLPLLRLPVECTPKESKELLLPSEPPELLMLSPY